MHEDSEKECKLICYNLILEVPCHPISRLSYSVHEKAVTRLSPSTRGGSYKREGIPRGGDHRDPFSKLPPPEDVSAVLNVVERSVSRRFGNEWKPFVILERSGLEDGGSKVQTMME